MLVGSVSLGGAEAVPDLPVLVFPPLWFGNSQHLPFGGTVTASFDTVRDILKEFAMTAKNNGLDALVLLNGHVGNCTAVVAAVNAAGDANSRVEILGLTYFDLAAPFIDEIRESSRGGMGHGGEFETSLMLHLFPELIHEDREGTYFDEPYDLAKSDLFENEPLSVYRPLDAYTEGGVIADPSLGTPEKGEYLFEGLTTAVAELLVDIREANQ